MTAWDDEKEEKKPATIKAACGTAPAEGCAHFTSAAGFPDCAGGDGWYRCRECGRHYPDEGLEVEGAREKVAALFAETPTERSLTFDETRELLGADPPREDLQPTGMDPISLMAFATRVGRELSSGERAVLLCTRLLELADRWESDIPECDSSGRYRLRCCAEDLRALLKRERETP